MNKFYLNTSLRLNLGVILFIICLVIPTFSQQRTFNNGSANKGFNEGQNFSSEKISELTAEKRNFSTGETANLKGNGFQPFEQVEIYVQQAVNSEKGLVSIGNWTQITDENGNVNFEWQIPSRGEFIVKFSGINTKRESQAFVSSAPAPVQLSGNPSCATLNASSDPRFAHIISNNGFKIDSPLSRSYTFSSADGTLSGNAPEEPYNQLTITFQNTSAGQTFDWETTKYIRAVIVKGGPNANVYPYSPEMSADTGLFSPVNSVNNKYYDVSHIEFCYDFAPTSAGVSVGGRVTSAKGIGVSKALVTISDLQGNTRTTSTNPFGYYYFTDVAAGSTYIVKAFTKNQLNSFNTQAITVFQDMEKVDFVAERGSLISLTER